MNKTLKNPNFYYIVIPVLAALWALMAGLGFYPKSVQVWDDSKEEYNKSKTLIEKLIALQPKRLEYQVDESQQSDKFDFTRTINDFAEVFSISLSNYNLNVRLETKRAGRRVQSASMSIKTIDIENLAQFLSGLLLRWPDLKCEMLSLEKLKNSKNAWKAEMSLTYYY